MALYFGTFNPMHAGHLAILNYLRRKAFSEVRMVVSPESPFKLGSDQTAEDRLEAVRAKVAELCPDVKVSDIEFHLPKPNYTINTLRKLQEEVTLRAGRLPLKSTTVNMPPTTLCASLLSHS